MNYNAYFDSDYDEASGEETSTYMVLECEETEIFRAACADACGEGMETLELVAEALTAASLELCHRLVQIRNLNNELQQLAEHGSAAWHKHETIDDRLHEILD